MKKKLAIALLATAVVVVALLTGAGFYLLDYALSNDGRSGKIVYNHIMERYPHTRPWLDSLRNGGILRDTFVVMADGRFVHALFARCDSARGRTAVLVHGYKDSATGMLHIAYIYNKVLGYNILLPDLHAHGQSDGNIIQMGWNDRLDVLHWTHVADDMFAAAGTPSRMVVHGVSMGGATTMNLACEPTPDYIRCFVEDCGYTGAWDEFEHEMGRQFGLPAFPLLHVSSALCKLCYGWSFGEASPLRRLGTCTKPMLFIHGGNDDFVPTSMATECYEAKPQPKELWIAPASGHAASYRDHRDDYTNRVANFVGRWID